MSLRRRPDDAYMEAGSIMRDRQGLANVVRRGWGEPLDDLAEMVEAGIYVHPSDPGMKLHVQPDGWIVLSLDDTPTYESEDQGKTWVLFRESSWPST